MGKNTLDIKEKKWSILNSFLAIVASIATVASIIFGFLWNSAVNATVQIQQPNGPLEVSLVDFPGVYSNLNAAKESLYAENENLKAELARAEIPTTSANAMSETTLPSIPDSLSLFDKTSPIASKDWRINNDSPIDTRGNRLANNVTYLVARTDNSYYGLSWAEYAVDGQYNMLYCDLSPHEEMSNIDNGKSNTTLVISVKREGMDTLEQVYPKEGENQAITTATKTTSIDISIGDKVDYVRFEMTGRGTLLLWNLRLYKN